MNTLPITLTQHWQPALQFLRAAVTLRTALVGAGFLAALSLGLVAANVGTAAFGCNAGQSSLVYPMYSSKGIVVDTEVRCGQPHRGCTERANAKGTFDCSPFMAPKGTLSAAR